jgi:uncharacterized alpha/beta hydrolase family protein
MLSEFVTNHGEAAFVVILLWVVLLGVIFSRRKSRKERLDPPSIFAPIRGLFVCYQCDTIFNTPQCPVCEEEAAIPLIHLTGSVIQNERLSTLIDRLQERGTLKLPVFQYTDADAPAAAASRPGSANGGASEVPLTLSLPRPEKSRELS